MLMGMPHHFWLQGELLWAIFLAHHPKNIGTLDISKIERMLHHFFLGEGGEGDSLNLGRL
jgi:hypothetical protein